jgi:uncharacterized protein YdaU (DUF1376 family)
MGPGRNAYTSLWLSLAGLFPAPITKDINMHYYKFNIADYRKDTVHLTPIEHYIYRSLIDWYYLDELPIPKETHSVTRRLCLGIESVPQLQNVLNDFFKLTDSGYEHKRIVLEIAEYHSISEINKVNGKKGGRPPKPIAAAEKTHPVNSANRNESERNPNHKPLTINQEPLTNNKIHTHLSMLLDVGVENQIAKDWLSIRKIKRLPLTPTAFESISKKIAGAGLTMNAGIKICVEQGWAGFSADWLTTVPELKLSGPHVNWYDTEEATHQRARREGVEIIDDLRLLRVRLNDVIQSKRK